MVMKIGKIQDAILWLEGKDTLHLNYVEYLDSQILTQLLKRLLEVNGVTIAFGTCGFENVRLKIYGDVWKVIFSLGDLIKPSKKLLAQTGNKGLTEEGIKIFRSKQLLDAL